MCEIKAQTKLAIEELIEKADLKKGMLVVVGCSTSEVEGSKIGTNSNVETAKQIVDTIYEVLTEKGIFLAGQCCEHLNRALVVDYDYAVQHGLEVVNVQPMPKAGGSFATNLFKTLNSPAVVEFIKADAGLDIGATMIGMHLKHVAVPIRLENNKIGQAQVFAAKTRAKFIGGPRANYSDMTVR